MVRLEKLDEITKEILNTTFPSYKGKKFRLEYTDSIEFNDTIWSGGTKSDYVIVKLDGIKAIRVPQEEFNGNLKPPYHGAVPLPEGFVVVEHSYFCGKDMGITFYCNPKVNVLPSTQDEKIKLTWAEEVVLVATRAYISSARMSEAKQTTGITTEQYNSAKQSLIEIGYLTKAGTQTVKGLNAVNGIRDISFLKSKNDSPCHNCGWNG